MLNNLLWFPTNMSLINGSWIFSSNKNEFSLFNPLNGAILTTIAVSSLNDTNEAVLSEKSVLKGTWGTMAAVDGGRVHISYHKSTT